MTYRKFYRDDAMTLWHGDALAVLSDMPAESVDCCVTSPPYFGLRDYGTPGQYGMEDTPDAYVEQQRKVFAEVRRVLTRNGTCWIVIGDSYAGKANAGATFDRHRGSSHRSGVVAPQRNMLAHAPYKSLLGIPWRLALALQGDGWTIRNDIVWHKPNAMPESVKDRLAGRYEHVFLLTKSPRYYFDLRAISGTMRDNPGDVWILPTQPFPEAHFATYPPGLVRMCLLAGCHPGGTVLDPYNGTGTTGMVAARLGDPYIGIDNSEKYLAMALRTRLAQSALIEGTA